VRIFVRKVPALSGHSHAVLEGLASRMTLEKVLGRTAVVREGEVGDRLYIVKEDEAGSAGDAPAVGAKGSIRWNPLPVSAGAGAHLGGYLGRAPTRWLPPGVIVLNPPGKNRACLTDPGRGGSQQKPSSTDSLPRWKVT
jgi:hypothetical protein